METSACDAIAAAETTIIYYYVRSIAKTKPNICLKRYFDVNAYIHYYVIIYLWFIMKNIIY